MSSLNYSPDWADPTTGHAPTCDCGDCEAVDVVCPVCLGVKASGWMCTLCRDSGLRVTIARASDDD